MRAPSISPISGRTIAALAVSMLLAAASHAESLQLRGNLQLEQRHFFSSSSDPRQADNHPSVAAEIELYHQWNDGDDAFTLTPFGRADRRDDQRSHLDLREANWLHVGDGWQLRSGIGKVFWGATESQHLVDIINQTDTLEGVDGEDKLGQPMVNLVWLLGQGELSLFWLPYFREREFAGVNGRPRAPLPIASDRTAYESAAERHHQDLALRWSTSIDAVDFALSHFRGTSREPLLIPINGNSALMPFYPQINQTGIELTAALGSWLWKLEAIRRQGFGDTYHAAVGGFEYTRVGIAGSAIDLGLLLERHYDERGRQASSPFQNDTFAGLRLTFNDFQSSELLTGLIYDHHSGARFSFIEASRRLGERFTLSAEMRRFIRLPADDPLFGLRRDDFVQLNLTYFF